MSNVFMDMMRCYYGIETVENKMTWTVWLALIFYFNKRNVIREMLNDLKIYPVELIMELNEKVEGEYLWKNVREKNRYVN